MPTTTEIDVNTAAESSPAAPDAKTSPDSQPTLDSVVDEVLAKAEPTEPDPEAEPEVKPKQDKTEEPPADGKPKEEKSKEEADADADSTLVEGKPVPYERFSEVIKERNEAREALDAAKPEIEQSKALGTFLAENKVSESDFQKSLELMALFNTDKQRFIAVLDDLKTGTEVLIGRRLSPELQGMVERGEITEAQAKTEMQSIARVRENELRMERMQAEAAQRQLNVNATTADKWILGKRDSDPSWKVKGNNQPSVFENDVTERFELLLRRKLPANEREVVKYLEDAETYVRGKFQQAQPKPPERKVLTTTGASITARKTPDTFEEMADAIFKQHGVE